MKFLAIKAVVPSRRVDNDEHLARIEAANAAHLGRAEAAKLARVVGQLFTLSGSQTRYFRAEGETALELTARAANDAIDAAGIARESIDLVIYAGVCRGFLEPATANAFIARLGLTGATGFDLLDACASWTRALDVARALMQGGCHRRVLIVNGEFNGELVDYHFESAADLRFNFARFTLGEAATATIIEHSGADCDYLASFRTNADLHRLCMIPLPNFAEFIDAPLPHARPMAFLSDSGPLLEHGMAQLVAHHAAEPLMAGYRPDIIFGHAASDVASLNSARATGMDENTVYRIHARYGNVAAASVPLAMACALDEGRLRHGDHVLIAVASAGLSTSGTRLRFLMPSAAAAPAEKRA